MKKKLALLLAILMCLSLCACGESSETSNNNEEQTKFESAELNNTITNEFCELTITKSVISHAVSEQETGLNLEEKEDNVYIVFLGTIKNTATSEIDFLSGLQAQVLIDNKYSYPVEIVPNDLNSVVPLKTADFAVYASVPEEVISSCNVYDFQFGFNDEFDTTVNSIEEVIYKYVLSGNIEEYGSAENIQNFQTFSEYINSFMSENGYNEKYKVTEEDDEVIIKDGNCLKFVSENGVEVSILPQLRLRYFSYELELPQYGVLEMEISGYREQENIHYISTEAITLKSSNGEITVGEGTEYIGTYDFNSVVADNLYYFDSSKLSLEKVYSIVTGDNFEIILNVKTLENENAIITYECDSEITETIIDLLDIYRQMPNSAME